MRTLWITTVIVSPLSRVALPNGLNGLQTLVTNHLLIGMAYLSLVSLNKAENSTLISEGG